MSETLHQIFRNTAPFVSFCTMAVISAMPIDAFADIDIKGRVFSESDSTALAGATCRLFAGTVPLTTTQTADDGSFSLTSKDGSSLTLLIENVGYTSSDISLEGVKKSIDLGTIYLSDAKDLQELVVTADGRRESRGKTIVIPSATDVKASSDALSLLRKLQLDELEINPVNRSMSVMGASVVILIDGIPSTQDDVNALNPSDISKVEYSRFVPARYADKGAGGFINIFLKKRNDGGSVYAWGRGCPTTGFVDGNVRGSYHQGASQFTLSYNPSWRSYNKVYDYSESSLIGDDFRVDLSSTAKSPFYYLSNPLNLRYIFKPEESLIFSATFNATIYNDSRSSDSDTHDSLLGDYNSSSKTSSKRFTPSLDLYLRKDFNSKSSLELEVLGTLSSTDYRHTMTENLSDGRDETYITDTDSKRRSLISEISYVHSFSDLTELSAGYQNTVSGNDNRYLATGYKATLTENNNYVYLQLSQQAGPVYLRFASGAKLFWMRNDLNNRHFIKNLSSLLASWKIDPTWTLTYRFNYSPSIPSLASLTDYPQQTSLYLISNGNPDLKVSDSFYNTLSLNMRKGIWTGSVNFRHGYTHNPVYSDVSYLGDGKFMSNSRNFNSQVEYDSWISVGVNGLAKMFGGNVTLEYVRYEAKGEAWRKNLDTFGASVSLWWTKGPFTISYWRKFPGKSQWGTSISKDETGDALDFQYKPDKHWTFDIGWYYMFCKKGTQYPSWNYSMVNPSYRFRNIENNGNMICLSISYQADFGSLFRTARRGLNNRDTGSSFLSQ